MQIVAKDVRYILTLVKVLGKICESFETRGAISNIEILFKCAAKI